jgi:carboxymethylenebutenolidase
MELNRRWVQHHRDGQSMSAYFVTPAAVKEPLPAVIVIQEIWGPDPHIQDVADRLAMAGYAALAPDLYSRGGRPEALAPERIEAVKAFMNTVPPGVWGNQEVLRQELAKLPGDDGAKIGATLGALFGPRDTEGMGLDLVSWADYLSQAPETRGMPVASVGYCMGGALSFDLASRLPRLKAALCYYGTAPSREKMAAIQCPVYGFYGETDTRITGAVPEVEKAMAELHKTYEARIYPGAGHAFFNDSRSSYHVGAARDAWARTLDIFNRHLAG